jgi:hypothetical protein
LFDLWSYFRRRAREIARVRRERRRGEPDSALPDAPSESTFDWLENFHKEVSSGGDGIREKRLETYKRIWGVEIKTIIIDDPLPPGEGK